MKNRSFYISLIVVLILSACRLSDHQLINNYELNVNHIQIISIQSEGLYIPFYAHDSIKMLELKYDSLYANKIESLNHQLDTVILRIEKIEKVLETIKNPLMITAIENRIKLMKNEQKRIEKILSIYQNTPEKTQLVEITERINYLKIIPDTLLGYTLKISFIGKQGALPEKKIERNYLFNSEKDSVLTVY